MVLNREIEMIREGLKALREISEDFEELLESPLPPEYIDLMSTNKNDQADYFRLESIELLKIRGHDVCDHYNILSKINTSIMASPLNSDILAKAYASRSAVFEHIGKFNESITAVDRALQITKTPSLKVKLLCQKAKCMAALGSLDGNKCIQEAKCWLNEVIDDESTKNTLTNLILKMEMIVEDKIQNPSDMEVDRGEIDNLFSITDESRSSVGLVYSKHHGRHLIAVQDIKPGEILIVEKTLNSAPISKKSRLYCWHCSSFLWDIVPCDSCIVGGFCSEQCKAESWEKYHEAECKILATLVFKILYLKSSCETFTGGHSSISSQLGLRIFFTALKQSGNVCNLRALLDSVDNCEDQEQMKKFPADDYKQIYALQPSLRIDDLDDLIRDCALQMVIFAKHTCIFEKIIDPHDVTVENLINNDDILYLGALLLRFCALVDYHSVENHRVSDCGEETPCQSFSSGSISQSCGMKTSLTRRSCIPNARKCMVGSNRIVLYSILPIEKGAPIFTSLLDIFVDVPKSERQKHFQQHHGFACDCQACREDWPVMKCEKDALGYCTELAPTLSGKSLEILNEFRNQILRVPEMMHDLSPAELMSKTSKLVQDSLNELPWPSNLTASIIRHFIISMEVTQGYYNRPLVSDECYS